MAACKCDASLNNTGFECQPLIAVSKKLNILPRFGSSGAENFIDTTSVGLNTQTFWDNLLNAVNPKDRLFPLPEHKNATSDRGDSVFESFDDGSKVFIRQGIRSNSILIVGKAATPTLAKKLAGYRCAEFGIIDIDRQASTIGSSRGETGKMYPILVDASTWDVKFVREQASNAGRILINFDWALTEKDEDLILFTQDEIAPVNPLRFEGLLDVFSANTGITTTGFVSALTVEYGTAIKKQGVTGLLITDFTLKNATTGVAVTITSVTENPNGTYTFVIPVQTSGTKLTLSSTKKHFDFTNVANNTILIP